MDFYSLIRERGLTDQAHQWASRVYWGQERLTCLKALQYVKAGSHCLDWGCGNGHFSYFLASHGFRTDAYAIHEMPPMLKGSGVNFTQSADPVSLPYKSETFDAAFGVGVLEHVHELSGSREGSIAELRRVLKPSGLLLIFHLPNVFSWIEYAKGLVKAQQHEKRFGRAEASSLFAGFDVLESGLYHFLPRRLFNKLPMRDSPFFSSAIDSSDSALSFLLRPVCQNWYFICRKR